MNPALNDGLVGQPPHKVPDIRLLERAAVERAGELATAVVPSGAARSTHMRSRGRGSVPSTMDPRFGGLLRARQLPSPSPPGPRAIAVVVRWEVPERRVQPARVVLGLDPLEDRAPRLAPPGQQRWLARLGARTRGRPATQADDRVGRDCGAWYRAARPRDDRPPLRPSALPLLRQVADHLRDGATAGVEAAPHRLLRNWPLSVLPLVALARHREVGVRAGSIAAPARRDAASAVVRQPPAGLRRIANKGAPHSGQ
jgi:hypothetical protein